MGVLFYLYSIMESDNEQQGMESGQFESRTIKIEYDSSAGGGGFLIDITVFSGMLKVCYDGATRKIKQQHIIKLLASHDWHEHYCDEVSGKKVLSESETLEHKHELHTARAIAQIGYDVLFAPRGIFKRDEKRFDIFLIREHVILKADMKSITSKNPDTIANRIKGGSDQASRVVVDICSDIEKKYLIAGLRSGVENNKLIKEIFLFYKNGFYKLPKDLIKSRRIFDVIK